MKLISVTLKNYRIHKDITVDFDGCRTLIGGPNECGKSTLIEAVHHALFLRSRVTGEMLQSLQSQFHSGHPTVALTFEADGKRYTVTKQFTAGTTATTMLTEVGGTTLRGSEAEEKVHSLCQSPEVARGRGLIDRIRSQWAHLWVWQGVSGSDPLLTANETQHKDKLCERLGQLECGGVLFSPLDNKVFEAVTNHCTGIFTNNGSPRADSPLAIAATALTQATAAQANALSTWEALELAVGDIDTAETIIASCNANITATRDELETVKGRLKQVAAMLVLEGDERRSAAATLEAYCQLQRADDEITACERHIQTLLEQMAPAEIKLATAIETEASFIVRFSAAMAAVSEAVLKQADVARAVELSGLCEQFERLKIEQHGLGGRCSDIRTLRTDVELLRTASRDLPSMSPEDLSQLNALDRLHENATSTLKAIATRIEIITGCQPIQLGKKFLGPGTAEIITTETDISIGEGTCLRIVPGGGRSLAEATQQRDDSLASLRGRLSALGLDTIEAAVQACATRQSLDFDIRAKELSIAGLGGDIPGRELEILEHKLAGLAMEILRRSPAEYVRPANLSEAEAFKRDAEEQSHLLVAAASSANANLNAAKELLDRAAAERSSAEHCIHSHRAEIQSLKTKKAVEVDRFGEDRGGQLHQLEQASRIAREKHEATCQRLHSMRPESLEEDAVRLDRAMNTLLQQKQNSEMKQQVAMGRLQLTGTVDPQGDLTHADAELTSALEHHAQRLEDAEAFRLLKSLFEQQRTAVQDKFVEPLKNRVTEYLKRLYGSDACTSVDFRDGTFRDLTISRPAFGSIPFKFSQLSGGAREQVAAAFRLAMAELLAEDHGGCLPVVFDDAFVNSDPHRIRELQRMLDFGASRGLQIVVLSCNATDYSSLGAQVVMLQSPAIPGGLSSSASEERTSSNA